MIQSLHRHLPVILMLCLGLAACSRSAPAANDAAPAGPESAFLNENTLAMDRMMAGMEVKPTGDVDRDFARMMIPHHQGAIDMAEALLRHGRNEELKTLARGIIAKQQEEIAVMRRILSESGSVPPASTSEPAGMQHHHTMG